MGQHNGSRAEFAGCPNGSMANQAGQDGQDGDEEEASWTETLNAFSADAFSNSK